MDVQTTRPSAWCTYAHIVRRTILNWHHEKVKKDITSKFDKQENTLNSTNS